MGQHRTKDQKIKAQIRREQMLYTLPQVNPDKPSDTSLPTLSTTRIKKDNLQTTSLQTYALKDLIHSGIATIGIVVILTVTYFYLR